MRETVSLPPTFVARERLEMDVLTQTRNVSTYILSNRTGSYNGVVDIRLWSPKIFPWKVTPATY